MAPDNPEVKQLKKIERQIDEIKDRTSSPWRALIGGVLYGAGWIVGSVATVALLGWILSLMGFVPGFGDIAGYLHGIVESWHGAK